MDKTILAKNVVLDGGLGVSCPNYNQIVFGGSGTGKTVSIGLATMCHMRNSSLMATFAKRGIVNCADAFFRSLGYQTKIWNVANPGKGETVPDPLDYVASYDDVQELAHQIANGNPEYQRSTKFDPYWREASESLLTGLIFYVLMTEKKPSMKKVIDLFYTMKIFENGKGITTTLDSKIEWLEMKAPESVAARKLRSYAQLPYATAGCVRDDLEKAIQYVFPVSIQSAMSEEAYVSFEEFASNRTAIFIITSPVRASSYGFANLLFGIAIRQLMEFAESQENNHLPKDVKLFFDDFCVAPILNYEKAIATFRAAGISSMMLCQSLSQLDAIYGPDNSSVIMDNCSTVVYLPGGMNKKTCSYMSEIINLPLEEVMFMEMGKVIIFHSGMRPVIAQRYNTYDDPMYQKFIEAGREKTNGKTEENNWKSEMHTLEMRG